jgi:uncharacterized coiled-coil protein SlyX
MLKEINHTLIHSELELIYREDALAIEAMSVEKIREALASLWEKKDDIERRLNRSPQKKGPLAVVEVECEFDELNKRIAKIRFQLRKLHTCIKSDSCI